MSRGSVASRTQPGHASVLWPPPSLAPGVVVFEGRAGHCHRHGRTRPRDLVGGRRTPVVFGGTGASFFTVHAPGRPRHRARSTLVLSEQPANTTSPVQKRWRVAPAASTARPRRDGQWRGDPADPGRAEGGVVPLARRRRTDRLHRDPHHTGTVLDDSDPFTSVGVAVFDATDPSTPLAVGGDGIAQQPGGGTGGTASLQVSSTSEYLVAVFSAGGTGTQASQYGYTAAGAFTLSWNGPNSPPDRGRRQRRDAGQHARALQRGGQRQRPRRRPDHVRSHADTPCPRHAAGHRRRGQLLLHP